MTTYEVIHDENGEPLASVCVKGPLTADDRAVLVEYFLWLRERRIRLDSALPLPPVERGPAHDPPPGRS